MLGKKMRDPNELRLDPRFDYMVGRMVGASEMMAHYMALHGDDKAHAMSLRVLNVIGFFLDEDSAGIVESYPIGARSESPTAVMMPKK